MLQRRQSASKVLQFVRCYATWAYSESSIGGARTPPAEWYRSDRTWKIDTEVVFGAGWRLADVHPLQPSSFRAGSLPGVEYLLTSDEDGQTMAFHNVCRHHAAIVVQGSGRAAASAQFECPYHGWTYGRDGRLLKASRLKGVQGFHARTHGLLPIPVASLARRFMFLHLSPLGTVPRTLYDWLGPDCHDFLLAAGIGDTLHYVRSRTYVGIRCNWKVFVDNYLDGGYHVATAHPRLAAGLNLSSYQNRIFENASVQTCDVLSSATADRSRLAYGETCKAAYAFIFPNVMINRYGPWMDVNIVKPTAANTCDVTFHWWVDTSLANDHAYVHESIEASDQVQQEDIALCELVQRGVESRGYRHGPYAPGLEAPMFHFHQLLQELYEDLDSE